MTKKILGLYFIATVISSVLFVACDKNETTQETLNAPTLTVSVATVHTTSDGGVYSFTYSVVNPVEDGAVSCSADASWISILDASSGSVGFTVAENTGEYRSGSVYLFYASSHGSITKTVTIVQSPAGATELIVQPTGVTADIAGGICSFTYTVTNPPSDGSLICRTDAEWINYFDYSVDGQVSFTVDENTTTDLRSGVISVEYISSDCDLYESVTVFQDHEGLDSNTSIDFSDIIGTYEATGLAYYMGENDDSATAKEQTWTVTIKEYSATEVKIYGLTPQISNSDYAESEMYVALATLNYLGQLVIPFQCTGYTTSINYSDYYIGWMPCYDYIEGQGWAHNASILDVTLTYDESAGVWTSDYGIFCAAFSIENIAASFYGFIDVVNPEFSLKRISSGTSFQGRSKAEQAGSRLEMHTDFMIGK